MSIMFLWGSDNKIFYIHKCKCTSKNSVVFTGTFSSEKPPGDGGIRSFVLLGQTTGFAVM